MYNMDDESTILSEADEASFVTSRASTPLQEAKTLKRSRSTSMDALWAHTREPDEGEKVESGKYKIMYCTYCGYSTPVATNFRRHLREKHTLECESTPLTQREDISQSFERLYRKAAMIGREKEIEQACFDKVVNQDVVNEALVSLIVVRNLAYRAVEWPEFHHLCMALNSRSLSLLPSSHSTMAGLISQSYESSKSIVRKRLEHAMSRIHISLDIWTSPNRLLLLGICCQFVGSDRAKIEQALLGLRPVSNHSGKEQWLVLRRVLVEYGILRSVGTIMGDNSSTNDTLCRAMSVDLECDEGIQWNPVANRLRCLGHILNLVVNAFLFGGIIEESKLEEDGDKEEDEDETEISKRQQQFRLLGPLGKLHNIVIHTRGSSSRTDRFKQLAKRMIPLDNRTRWNSWYYMLDVALQQEVAIDAYTKEHLPTLTKDYLLPEDWALLRELRELLHPFEQATLENQGKYARIDQVLLTMDSLFKHLDIAVVCPYFSCGFCLLLSSSSILYIYNFLLGGYGLKEQCNLGRYLPITV
jgi:hypothetical protein